MESPNNLNATSMILSIGSFIGTLSGLEASMLLLSGVITLAVGVSAIRMNNARTNYYQRGLRKENEEEQ